MLFWLGENRPRAPFEACFNLIRPNKMALTFDLDFQIIFTCHKCTYGILFDRNRPNIITFEQVDPDMSFYRFEHSDWRPSWKYANKKLPLGEI